MSKIHVGWNRPELYWRVEWDENKKVTCTTTLHVSPGLTTMTEASHPTALAASPEESGADVDAAHSACSTSRFDMMDFLESLSSTQVISHVSLPDAGACGLGVVGARTAGYGLGFPLERR